METAALLEPAVRRALCARAAEAAYLRRAHRRAAKWAAEAGREVGGPFAEALARLEDGAAPPRVCLNEVPHVRQHHVTCAPASLCSVAAYHGDPQDQRAIADAITYAGTPLWAQRRWAEERGYLVRELDVTLEAARALIDAGLPFVLSTFGTVDGHAQVVIGYDEARRSLLVRDPSVPARVAVLAPAGGGRRRVLARGGRGARVPAPPRRRGPGGASPAVFRPVEARRARRPRGPALSRGEGLGSGGASRSPVERTSGAGSLRGATRRR